MKNEGEKPWAKVLRHKYCRRADSSKAPKSRTWAAIKKGVTLCEKGMKWVLSSNSQLSFWVDKWLDFGSLRSCIEGPPNKGEEELRVLDVQKDGMWDLHCISFELTPLIAHSIWAIPIRAASRREDHVCWISSSKGEFDSKNAYMLAAGINPNEPKFAGNWVWNLKILPKIQLFVWKCLLKSIPTKSILALRGFGGGTSCDWCHEDQETIAHVLRDCPIATSFWAEADCPPQF